MKKQVFAGALSVALMLSAAGAANAATTQTYSGNSQQSLQTLAQKYGVDLTSLTNCIPQFNKFPGSNNIVWGGMVITVPQGSTGNVTIPGVPGNVTVPGNTGNVTVPGNTGNTSQPGNTGNVSKPGNAGNTGNTSKPGNTGNTGNVSKPSTGSGQSSNSQFVNEVFNLVNQERAKAGLSQLTLDTALSNMAQDKAKDMYANNYFDHNSPTYGSPFDMMRQYNIPYSYAGENIAKGQRTPQEVMNAWMNSPGHRANILNPNFKKIGVAFYNYEWVQEFTG